MSVVPDLPQVSVQALEVFAEDLDPQRAAAIYREYGCLVVRGLMKPYLERLARDIDATAARAISLADRAEKITEGWRTPDGTLFLPAPPGFVRDKQIMVLAVGYQTSAAFFHSAFDPKALDVVEAILGPNVELFMNGQCLYKEPVGGHPKHLHQDSSYFEHRYEGPVATLSYVVDTDLVNGALHVVPGSHRFGTLRHVDTFSHLGLDPNEWPWERALPVCGNAGDSIIFHYKCIHGSKENHSRQPRPVFIHRYRRPDDYVTVSATTTEKRAAGEKQAEQAKKDAQRGFMVRGFRPFEE
jgi:phytanoyl-CoA hydroxylase